MVGVLEAVTSSIGDELTDLFGYASTRTTTITAPEAQYQTAASSLSYDGNVTVNLTSGTFLLGVAAGMVLRWLSGGIVGGEATIASRDSGTQLTLLTPFPDAVPLVNQSWEVIVRAETIIEVENALEFSDPDAPGRIVVDGVVYRYTGKTPTSFTGVQHEDGQGLLVDGVKLAHPPLSIVSDYSRAQSAVDKYWRGFLVNYAHGEDLDLVGANLGVVRPPELSSDETYRALIKALAYAPRGTVFAMEQVLDALVGETQLGSGTETAVGGGDPFLVDLVAGSFPLDIVGTRFRVTSGFLKGRTVRIAERISATQIRLNLPMEESFRLQSWEITRPDWELFEDLTLGSINHPCKIYARRLDEDHTNPAGKAFVDGYESVPLASPSTINFTGRGHLTVASVRLKPEGASTLVAQSTEDLAESVAGVIVTCPDFPANIREGDLFTITSGPLAGQAASIVSRDSATQITLGWVSGLGGRAAANGTIGSGFAGVSWTITREKGHYSLYRPSNDIRLEHPADAGTTAFAYLGATETTKVTLPTTATHGRHLLIAPGSGVCAYQRILRITPESSASAEILLDVAATLATGAGDGKQVACGMGDGERFLAWGVIETVGGLQQQVGLINAVTGAFIGTPAVWSDVPNTKFSPGWNVVKLVKRGRDRVQLWRQARQGHLPVSEWEKIDEVSYASFPTTGAWIAAAGYAANARELVFGCLAAGYTGSIFVKHVDWRVEDLTEYWNHQSTGSTSSTNELEDLTNPFVVGDVGKTVRIKNFGSLNAGSGNSLGEWLITARPNAAHVTLTGRTQSRGYFSQLNTSALFVRGDSPFVWPDHRGHSVEILDGPNAGVYPILAILNPSTLEDLDDGPQVSTIASSSTWTSAASVALRVHSYAILLDTTPVFEQTAEECTWRVVPSFPVGGPGIVYELVAAGADSAGTLTTRTATPHATGTVMSVYASKVLSAFLFHQKEMNAIVAGDYTMWPFYLYDAWGYIRRVMDLVSVAGVQVDLDNMYVDDAGPHLLDPR